MGGILEKRSVCTGMSNVTMLSYPHEINDIQGQEVSNQTVVIY